jgi:general secretion pathway protein G
MRNKALLYALVIFGLLLAGFLVLPGIIGQSSVAKVKAAESQLGRLSMAIGSFKVDVGEFPARLNELIENTGNFDNWNGPYVKPRVLQDPWGNPLNYEFSTSGIRIESYGADKRPGGEKDNGDLFVQLNVDE